ncbi:hypothetical protein CNMCM7691_001526 [Aspergillus felis]|uniref:BTB domain-containing protein n=1 Tax=Aspergillus felis TaxID=1287682 RepID=A0A8H6QZY6_9EURO|nr:hypothetical protein CNMCM7691_001526 [Aspergillus felis]
MNRITHIIDPDGEAVIILRNANSPFAQPDEDMIASIVSQHLPEQCDYVQGLTEDIETSTNHTAKSMLTPKNKKKKKNISSSAVWTSFGPTPLPVEVSAQEAAEEQPAEEPSPEPVEEQPAEEPSPAPAEEQPAGSPIDDIGLDFEQQDESRFRIQVSAKHLMLASSVFKKECVAYRQNGSVEINAKCWDIEALLILLRAIHNQHYSIPRKLTLEMLAKVAVLADYYKCKEVVCIWPTV